MSDEKEPQKFEELQDASKYGDSDIQEATAEIQQLTPEAYIDMKRYIDYIAEQSTNPEANAVAATTMYGQQGGYMYLSARSESVVRAIDELMVGIRYATTFGLSPGEERKSRSFSAPAQPAPAATPTPAPTTTSTAAPKPAPTPGTTAAPAANGSIEAIEVSSVRHQISPTGVHFFNVKGGKWTKHGYPAWIEVVESAGVDINVYELGVEYQPPIELSFAWIDLNKKKVIRFASAA